MKMQRQNIYGWQGYQWKSDDVVVGFVPQLGGRIISLQYRGKELFFVQEDRAGEIFASSELKTDKKKFGFRFWGGDKTWIAPEDLWVDRIPPLDLDAGKYAFARRQWGKSVVMTSPVCRETGVRIIREVKFKDQQSLFLTETIKNERSQSIARGIWNVSQLQRPFEVYFPCAFDDVRLYSDEAFQNCQPQYYVLSAGEYSGIFCRDEAHFKFGAYLKHGQVVIIKRYDDLIITFSKTFPIIPGAPYAHGSHVEVYNSPRYPYGEVEIHSPMMTLKGRQGFTQRQEWRLDSFAPDASLENIFKSIR